MFKCYLPILLSLFLYGFNSAGWTYDKTDSAICIESQFKNGGINLGAGFYIAPGLIATVEHEVKNADKILIHKASGKVESAQLAAMSKDLAILTVADKSTPSFVLANALPVHNATVHTYGCHHVPQSLKPQLLVSQPGVVTDPARLGEEGQFIEARLPVQKGNSGGPLLNEANEVLGIVNGYDSNQVDLSVSIPIHELIIMMAQQRDLPFEPDITELWNKAHNSGNSEEQIQLYDKILQKAPWHTEALYNQGLLFQQQNNFAAAAQKFKLAVQQRPNYYNAYIYLGVAYFKQKQYPLARDALLSALQLEPANSVAYLQLAGVYKEGFADGVSEYNALRQYLELAPSDNKASQLNKRLEQLEQELLKK